jgi:hypothetical protein
MLSSDRGCFLATIARRRLAGCQAQRVQVTCALRQERPRLRRASGYLRLGSRTGSGQTLVQVLGESLAHSGCLPVALVWLSHGMRLAEHRARSGWKGACSARSSGALLADIVVLRQGELDAGDYWDGSA